MPRNARAKPTLEPLAEAWGGGLHDKQKALPTEIIQRVNDLSEGDRGPRGVAGDSARPGTASNDVLREAALYRGR